MLNKRDVTLVFCTVEQQVSVYLINNVVLIYFGRCKVRANIDESWQTAGRDALQSLQSRCWSIGN